MPILNYSTKIDHYKTISEITKCLSQHGARKIIVDNITGTTGIPSGLTFSIDYKGVENGMYFALPCNFKGILKSMQSNKKVPRALCNEEQALRVGWRILKDWVMAQMAIVESDLASMAEVFLPYAVTKSGTTLYQYIESEGHKLLAEGK